VTNEGRVGQFGPKIDSHRNSFEQLQNECQTHELHPLVYTIAEDQSGLC